MMSHYLFVLSISISALEWHDVGRITQIGAPAHFAPRPLSAVAKLRREDTGDSLLPVSHSGGRMDALYIEGLHLSCVTSLKIAVVFVTVSLVAICSMCLALTFLLLLLCRLAALAFPILRGRYTFIRFELKGN